MPVSPGPGYGLLWNSATLRRFGNQSGLLRMAEIGKFVEGFKRFQDNYFGGDQALYRQLRRGQTPDAMVIACSDSRVDPALLMDCEPGDLFVVRNVANLVPPYETGGGLHGVSAALEFGVCVLGVQHLIVLGHTGCGGIRALMQGIPQELERVGEFVTSWVNISARARERVLQALPGATVQEQSRACEQASIQVSLENLQTFPWIRERLQQGKLILYGWYFDIQTGKVLAYNPSLGHFEPLL